MIFSIIEEAEERIFDFFTNNCETLNLSSNVIDNFNYETNFPLKLSLTNQQV